MTAAKRPLALAVLVALEQEIRKADSRQSLGFLLVNESFQLLGFRRAVLWVRGHVVAVSGCATIDRNAPLIVWLDRFLDSLAGLGGGASTRQMGAAECDPPWREGWRDFEAPVGLFVPLRDRNGAVIGALWFSLEQAVGAAELAVLDVLADAAAHAWLSLDRPARLPVLPPALRRYRWAGAVLAVAVLAWPVRQSALAPGEVVACTPMIAAPPIDGVVAEILVRPNQAVAPQTPLFRLDGRLLRSQAEVAAKALAGARAELLHASQKAFDDPDSKAELARLKSLVAEKEAEAHYYDGVLERAEIRADRPGIAVFADAADWIGKPVRVGERVMSVVDPADVCLKLHLPVDDAMDVPVGAAVSFFLNIAPLRGVAAQISEIGYEPEPVADTASWAYALKATFSEGDKPRVGLKGTARIEGDRVSLLGYLARRPVAAFRRVFG